MESLDGNAIAGTLLEFFGTEMTMAVGSCRHCRSASLVAELDVYLRAPGAVVRCRHCGEVVMVVVSIEGTTRVDLAGFEIDPPSHGK